MIIFRELSTISIFLSRVAFCEWRFIRVLALFRVRNSRQNDEDARTTKTGQEEEHGAASGRTRLFDRTRGWKADCRDQGKPQRGPRPLPVASDFPARVARN